MEDKNILNENYRAFNLSIKVTGEYDDKTKAAIVFPVNGKMALEIIRFANEKINSRIDDMEQKEKEQPPTN